MMAPQTMLALLLGLAAVSISPSSAVVVPLGATRNDITDDVLAAACIGQGNRNVCFPAATGGRDYISCSPPRRRTCRSGTRFDYAERHCLPASRARPCPAYNCPVALGAPGPALSAPIGRFGVAGNTTISLTKAESFSLICPVHGHCMGGMSFTMNVACPAPADRTPYTFSVNFVETVANGPNHTYPRRLPDLNGFCGDSLFVEWPEATHSLQIFNTSAAASSLWRGTRVVPYPPQPVYSCPVWPTPLPAPDDWIPFPLEGEEVVRALGFGPWNVTWTANRTEEFFFSCPISNHCRLGQGFKVTVLQRPAGRAIAQTNITWALTGDLFPDLTLYIGDSVTFFVPAFPPMAHAVHKTPSRYFEELP